MCFGSTVLDADHRAKTDYYQTCRASCGDLPAKHSGPCGIGLPLESFGLGIQSHSAASTFTAGIGAAAFRRGTMRILFCGPCLFAFLFAASRGFAQTAPNSPDHPWHTAAEHKIEAEATAQRAPRFSVDPNKTYTLAELVDLAESHNPETRLAWERARAQAAALGIARSEL